MMVAVRAQQPSGSVTNVQLEATLHRIAMRLYIKAHVEAPPSAVDFGRGLYNILV